MQNEIVISYQANTNPTLLSYISSRIILEL